MPTEGDNLSNTLKIQSDLEYSILEIRQLKFLERLNHLSH